MDEEIYKVEILGNRKESPAFHLLTLAKPKNFDFTCGQYIKASAPDSAHFTSFAIASHPSEYVLELLIKPSGMNAERICSLPVGTSLEITRPIGPGFPVDNYKNKTIYMICHGSAISAMKPVVEELRENRNQYGPIRLLYGVRNAVDFPFRNMLRDWMGSVEFYDIISRDPGDLRVWTGETGHVQDILVKLQPEPYNSVALIAGSLTMENQVKKILEEFEFTPESIYRNHNGDVEMS